MKRLLSVTIIGACVVLSSAGPLSAAGSDAPRAAMVRAVPQASAAVTKGPLHRVFGWLASVNGTSLTLQLRGGRLLKIDATGAFASNRVSAPLYRGKPTVVTGTLSGGVLFATAVTRAVPQSASWDIDR